VATRAAYEPDLTAGHYPALVLECYVPDLLGDLPAGAALGPGVIAVDPPSWGAIGLGAIQDVIQHAFGLVDLDRSAVELEALSPGRIGCPACPGRRDLGIALGEDPEYGPGIPDWLLNLILELGRAAKQPQAKSLAGALACAEPELRGGGHRRR
jgi:hypothetical protein